ncbi:hypothetical protein, partial [Pyramidobacter piscolens]|uniref:hypothetical protein n=1 Tax=Pyramidobacter piscolens TaxID=638849 RepID=UPI00248F74C8
DAPRGLVQTTGTAGGYDFMADFRRGARALTPLRGNLLERAQKSASDGQRVTRYLRALTQICVMILLRRGTIMEPSFFKRRFSAFESQNRRGPTQSFS